MNYITYFNPQPDSNDLPDQVPSPFDYEPHPLAQKASLLLQQLLESESLFVPNKSNNQFSTMFGVLVVKDSHHKIGYLKAFAGSINQQWITPGFAPPVFSVNLWQSIQQKHASELNQLNLTLDSLINTGDYPSLKNTLTEQIANSEQELAQLKQLMQARKAIRQQQREIAMQLSEIERGKLLNTLGFASQQDKREFQTMKNRWQQTLHRTTQQILALETQIQGTKNKIEKHNRRFRKEVNNLYVLNNAKGEQTRLQDLFTEKDIPQGSGDCVAVKLLQLAYTENMTPLAFAQFWWGSSPQDSIRHHKHYYPACRGRCGTLLPFMLTGLSASKTKKPWTNTVKQQKLVILFEDEDIIIIDKPAGLLSVPGTEIKDSVLTQLQQRYPEATGPLLLHRLDMATSGIMLAAKNKRSHKILQRQFIRRTIQKRYVALLAKRLADENNNGSISLPLRVDYYDRPRQLVCFAHGKPATTHWEVIAREHNKTRVFFYPVTGRTHQIRLHAAHQSGLNAAIVGDKLYGDSAERMMLHANYIGFNHPNSGEQMEFESPAPF